jgi:hypothetical protein
MTTQIHVALAGQITSRIMVTRLHTVKTTPSTQRANYSRTFYKAPSTQRLKFCTQKTGTGSRMIKLAYKRERAGYCIKDQNICVTTPLITQQH